MHATRPLGPAVKAETFAAWNGLPHGRITEHDGVAQVVTTSLKDLEDWYIALGGRITPQEATPGNTLWVLHTDTDHGNGAPVVVHAIAPITDQLDETLTHAIRPHVA